jgi:heavy metal sensor kinase
VWFFKSLRFRLTIWYLLVIAALLACLGTITYLILSYQLHRNLDESLRSAVLEFESGLKLTDGEISYTGQTNDLVLVYKSDGSLVYKLGPDVDFTKTDSLVERALLGKSNFTTESEKGQPVRLYITPYTLAPDTRMAIIIGKAPTDIQQTLVTFRSAFLISGFFALLFAAFYSSKLANRVLYPIRGITGTAEDIGATNLDRRIDIQREDELGKLATTLNGMMERLEVAFNRQRQFAADASHELRTPLSVIQAESTLALSKERTAEDYKKSLEVISQEVDFMSTVIGNLLQIARNETGEPLRSEHMDIKNVLNNLSPTIEALTSEKGIQFNLHLAENLFVKGDPTKLKQLFNNLFENAVRYTPSGGTITVDATASDGSAVISVSDNGVGIAPEHLSLIFERFYRVDKARSRAEGGAGLGLSIAKQIAELHGGTITVESQLGQGSTFRVFLPLDGSIPK